MCMTGGTVGKSYFVEELPEPMLVNQRVADIKTNDKLNKKYCYYFILSPYIQKIIVESKNSTNDNISVALIYSFIIPVPPIAEQERIVKEIERFSPLLAEYDKLEQQATKLDDEIYDNLKKLFASMEHVNYFIVTTDKAGTIRNCGLNERRIVCPVNENNAEEEEKQWDFYNKWLSSSLAKKLVIVELGEDFSNPNVIRWPFERIVMINQKAKMYRVHSTFYQIPKEIGDRACAFEMNGAQFIKELVKCC